MKNICRYLIGFIIGIILMIIPYFYINKTTEEETVNIDTIHITSIDTIFVPIETIKYKNSIIVDTVYLSPLDSVLLVEQKEYEDSISTIWISGIEPKIDSIEYRIPKDTFFINKEITIKETKRVNSGFTISVGIGTNFGYNPITGKFEPTIGISGVIGYGVCISKKK